MQNLGLKLILALAITLSFPTATFAQTKEATEAWIIKQTEPNNESLKGEFKYSIEGDKLVSRHEIPYILQSAGKLNYSVIQKSIPLKSIKIVSFVHTKKYVSFNLICEDDCMHQQSLTNDNKVESERRSKKFLFEIYANLDKSFPPRLEKALLHLIELNGGKAKVVKIVEQKEPF